MAPPPPRRSAAWAWNGPGCPPGAVGAGPGSGRQVEGTACAEVQRKAGSGHLLDRDGDGGDTETWRDVERGREPHARTHTHRASDTQSFPQNQADEEAPPLTGLRFCARPGEASPRSVGFSWQPCPAGNYSPCRRRHELIPGLSQGGWRSQDSCGRGGLWAGPARDWGGAGVRMRSGAAGYVALASPQPGPHRNVQP